MCVCVCFQTTVHLVITEVQPASQHIQASTHINQDGRSIHMTSSCPLRLMGKRGQDKELERKRVKERQI